MLIGRLDVVKATVVKSETETFGWTVSVLSRRNENCELCRSNVPVLIWFWTKGAGGYKLSFYRNCKRHGPRQVLNCVKSCWKETKRIFRERFSFTVRWPKFRQDIASPLCARLVTILQWWIVRAEFVYGCWLQCNCKHYSEMSLPMSSSELGIRASALFWGNFAGMSEAIQKYSVRYRTSHFWTVVLSGTL